MKIKRIKRLIESLKKEELYILLNILEEKETSFKVKITQDGEIKDWFPSSDLGESLPRFIYYGILGGKIKLDKDKYIEALKEKNIHQEDREALEVAKELLNEEDILVEIFGGKRKIWTSKESSYYEEDDDDDDSFSSISKKDTSKKEEYVPKTEEEKIHYIAYKIEKGLLKATTDLLKTTTKDERKISVAHSLAVSSDRTKWKTEDKEILLLKENETGNTVAHFLAYKSDQNKWKTEDKDILKQYNNKGYSVAYILAWKNLDWSTEDEEILSLKTKEQNITVKEILEKRKNK